MQTTRCPTRRNSRRSSGHTQPRHRWVSEKTCKSHLAFSIRVIVNQSHDCIYNHATRLNSAICKLRFFPSCLGASVGWGERGRIRYRRLLSPDFSRILLLEFFFGYLFALIQVLFFVKLVFVQLRNLGSLKMEYLWKVANESWQFVGTVGRNGNIALLQQ